MARPVVPPRIFCIPASRAAIVAVLRRGPTAWYHVGRWDEVLMDQDVMKPGDLLQLDVGRACA
jgi:hypothetical protein